ncbi:MAG TPA: alpha/beta fold hydrolase [Chloroflexota bacterium]
MKRRQLVRVTRLLLGVSLLFVGWTANAHGQPSVPRFESAACPFRPGLGITQGTNLSCGYLIVPENRTAGSGRTIRLAVAVFKSPAAHPAPDPVIFLRGGPGGNLVSEIGPAINATTLGFWAGDHDLVLIDQRGTGDSSPFLQCRELVSLEYRTIDRNLSVKQSDALQAAAARQCHTRLVASKIDLSGFTTHQNAADIADLRSALGYASVNLYGESYGTRLALEVMRSFPDGIRSVVLDSVVPPNISLFSDPLRSMGRDFKLLFSSCAASRACNSAHPQLAARFYRLTRQLQKKPVQFKAQDPSTGKTYTVLLNGDGLDNLLFSGLYVSSLIPQLPDMITSLQAGRLGPAAHVFSEVGFLGNSLSFGMYYSVECSGDAPYTTAAQVRAAGAALNPAIRTDEVQSQIDLLRQCGFWNVKPDAPAERQPVRSSIPTIVLSGQMDPVTPPANGSLVVRTLSHGYRFVFPGLGHGERFTDICPYRMVASFLDDPSVKPDDSCIARMSSPF